MFVLDSATIVFIGHFNPFLISPEWLSREQIWVPSEVQLVLGALKQDAVRFQGDGVAWELSSDKMMISSATVDCGQLAKQILERLPHTPVAATGSNFVFQDAEMSRDHNVFKKVRDLFPIGYQQPDLFRWSIVLHENDVRVEVAFISGEQGATFSVNRHRKTENSSAAIEAVVQFQTDRQYAEELVGKLLEGVGK